jgi:predicted kinase
VGPLVLWRIPNAEREIFSENTRDAVDTLERVEAVIFCGIQGSGKSTFYTQRFAETHVRINLDMLKTRRRESILLHACIAARQPFVVDNTNATIEARRRYITPARIAGFRVVAFYFHTDVGDAIARTRARVGKNGIRPGAIVGTYRRLQPPSKQEGYAAIHVVTIDGLASFVATEIDDLADGPLPGLPPLSNERG